jgi:predicted MPP superfamily phosphohydrolase
MTREEIKSLLTEAEKIFAEETNLIRLESGRVVFVGDTHGDFEATSKVIEMYLKPGNKLVFLGDYVDRGPASLENINFLLQQKLEHPDSIFLLMGNHEGYGVVPFSPANFWEGLDAKLRQRYIAVLSQLPLAASTPNGVIALHGALPDVPSLGDINRIKPGDDQWHQITWGDWQEREGGFLGFDSYTGRPQFGQGWFEEIMSRFDKNVLIRSHQPNAPQVMYGGRCLTIFTSSAYKHYIAERTVAVLDSEEEVKSVADIKIEVV